MRKGINPAKEQFELGTIKQHRIIIPVYIPNEDDYFKHSLEILDICLRSLHHTITYDNTVVSVISNGSSKNVNEYLINRQELGWIDQLIVNKNNYGKLDSVMSIGYGSYEPFLTFADCDAFFYPGWESAVSSIFSAYPEAGWVSPLPAPNLTWLNTSSTIYYSYLKGILREKRVVATSDLNRFATSIGVASLYSDKSHEHYLTVLKNNSEAIVGGSHFVFTIRQKILKFIPHIPSFKFIAEEEFFGKPFDETGYWRLSTPDLHVQHMGNTPETWMYDDLWKLETHLGDSPIHWSSIYEVGNLYIPYPLRYYFSRLFRRMKLTKFSMINK